MGNRNPAGVVTVAEALLGDAAGEVSETAGDRTAVAGVAGEVAPRPGATPGKPLVRERLLSLPGSAYLKIAEGCDNRCSYCAIPLIRGPLRSRDSREIVTEAEELFGRGIREINLIAQDLASYGVDTRKARPAAGRAASADGAGRATEGELVALLRRLSALEGRHWVRLLYMHPDHFPRDILSLMEAEPRILPYFDIPFQHASARVLRRMGRRGSASSYLALIREIRDRLPDAVIRSTFLCGFPGETRVDLEELLEFQRQAQLEWVGVFAYSREEGTPAARYPGQVRRAEADRRKELVQEVQVTITEARLQRFVGRRLTVLIEQQVTGEPLAIGRAYLQAPEVDGAVVVHCADPSLCVPGSFVEVDVSAVRGVDLEGEAVRG